MKYVGLSECSADQIRRAHAITPITALEIEWSLWERGNEVRRRVYIGLYCIAVRNHGSPGDISAMPIAYGALALKVC